MKQQRSNMCPCGGDVRPDEPVDTSNPCNACAWGIPQGAPPVVPTEDLTILVPYDTSCGPGFLARGQDGTLHRVTARGTFPQIRPGGPGLPTS